MVENQRNQGDRIELTNSIKPPTLIKLQIIENMESELIKQWNSNPKPQTPLGMFGILKESFKTVKRNRKLLFPVLVLVFLFFSQLEFAEVYLLQPVAEDLSLQLAENPKLFQDLGNNNMNQNGYKYAFKAIRELLLVKLFLLILSSIISLVFLVATVSSSSEAYTSKVIDLKEMILKIKKSWKKPILTSFYMILILVGLLFVTSLFIGIITILAKDTWAYLFYGVLGLLITVVGFYVSALWMTSLVVSVLEDVSGLNANVRAIELMKGKNVKASLIMVFFALAYGLLHSMTNAIPSHNLDKWTQLAISIPLANALRCALKLFMFVVFTVFYHEQKQSYDEKEAKGVYVPIVVGEV